MNNVLVYIYNSTPPVTRIVSISIVFVALMNFLEVCDGPNLSFSWYHLDYIVKNHKYMELYRLITAPLHFGHPSVENYLHILFFYRYSCILEESFVYVSEYVYIIFLCFVSIIIASLFVYVPNMGPTLSCIITYIWTRKNPRAVVQTYGFVTFYAFYLPFILPVFTLIYQSKIQIEELLGIVCGHIIYFFRECYPKFGHDFLKTPCFLHHFFNEQQECCKVPKTDKKSDQNISKQNKVEDSENYESDDFTEEEITKDKAFNHKSDEDNKEALNDDENKSDVGEFNNVVLNCENNAKSDALNDDVINGDALDVSEDKSDALNDDALNDDALNDDALSDDKLNNAVLDVNEDNNEVLDVGEFNDKSDALNDDVINGDALSDEKPNNAVLDDNEPNEKLSDSELIYPTEKFNDKNSDALIDESDNINNIMDVKEVNDDNDKTNFPPVDQKKSDINIDEFYSSESFEELSTNSEEIQQSVSPINTIKSTFNASVVKIGEIAHSIKETIQSDIESFKDQIEDKETSVKDDEFETFSDSEENNESSSKEWGSG